MSGVLRETVKIENLFIYDWKYNSVTLEDQSGFIRRDSYSGDEHTPLGYLRHSLETGIRCDRG